MTKLNNRKWSIVEYQLINWFRSLRQMHKSIRRKNKHIHRLKKENEHLRNVIYSYEAASANELVKSLPEGL